MIFELGKYYQHTAGVKLHICGIGDTQYYGKCFIGENEFGELIPVGCTEVNAVNYAEITKDEFIEERQTISNYIKDLRDIKTLLMAPRENYISYYEK